MKVDDSRVAEFEEEQRLLRLCREGDSDAYATLFDKHWLTSVGYARRFAGRSADPEELAQEAFTRVMETITRGKGPTVSMGHYLRTTIRTVAAGRARSKSVRDIPTEAETLSAIFEADAFHDDQNMSEWLVEGFNRLTDRQQHVVWEHAVERRSLRSIAPDLGVSPVTALRAFHQAVSALREGFVQATAEASSDSDCALFVADLVSGDRAGTVLENHLLGCRRCQAVRRRLEARSEVLMSVVLVAGLGDLGLAASDGAARSAAAWWFAGLALPAKVALVAAPVIAVVVGGIVLLHGNSSVPARPMSSVSAAIALGSAPSSSALATFGECQVIRDTVPGAREIWRLAGGDACGLRVEAVGGSEASGSAVLLDTQATPSRLAIEITRPGGYALVLRDAAQTQEIAVEVRP